MKKFLAVYLVLMIIALLCGCANNNNNNETEEIEEQPKTTVLTVNNIEDYIIFNTDISEPDVFENVYAGGMNCEVKLTVKTSSKKNIEYDNLKVSFKMVAEPSTKGYGWDKIFFADTEEEFLGILDIPYNGVSENVFKIESQFLRYVTDDPNLKLVITQVSGAAIE